MQKKTVGFLFLMIAFFQPAAWAAVQEGNANDKGCYSCHRYIKPSYLRSTHGRIFSYFPGSPLEARGCEACHGSDERHSEVAGDLDYQGPLYSVEFKSAESRSADLNQICIQCHEGGSVLHWSGSQHQMDDVACVDCHTLHQGDDKVASEVCGSCHVEQRAKMLRSSHASSPGRAMNCLDCHSPHGGLSEGALQQSTVSETCYQCHAELRGPFLWEHAPVREDCGNCHDAHGSNNDAMLSMRAPYLCQSCHQMLFHSSNMNDGSGLAAGSRSAFVVGGSCVNCHALIHGSNHPSGARFQR